jgi:arginyl-tRNA synthetase
MDHHGYVARVKASMGILGYDMSILHVDFINMVKIFKGGELLKMSKRAGTSLTINDVLKIMEPDLLRFFILSKAKEQNLDIVIEDIEKQDSSNPF